MVGVPRGLGVAVTVLLGVVALSDLLAVVAGARSYSLISGDSGFVFAAQHDLEAADNLYRAAGLFQAVAYIACAAVFITWFLRMRRCTGLLAPDRFRRAPGWAVACWFVPIGNFWLPYGVALDMWRAASVTRRTGADPRGTPSWPLTLWWILFAGTTLFERFASSAYRSAVTLTRLRQALVEYMVVDAANIVAAGAAVYFVVRLTDLARRKAEHASAPWGPAVNSPNRQVF
ncbi:DUF4328 domain-containing protein [Streptomyces sp. NPDC090306]|uniref:DUF4328 domain-containing protein n=1 Tax=Streptomyces sp. NPDC090306 TaxID=3365961 RepID=UPI0037F2ABB6